VWLYGDPFASAKMYEAVHGLIHERSLWDWHHVTILPREVFKSFVGYFGYTSLKLPKWTYALYLIAILFALAGLIPTRRSTSSPATETPEGPAARRQLGKRPGKRLGEIVGQPWVRVLIVLFVTILCSYAVVVRINVQFAQTQGRYLFPALPALAIAVALGLDRWRPWRLAATLWPARAAVAAWGAANLAILGVVVVPAYYPPIVPALSDAQVTLTPEAARDLERGPDGRFGISGPRPELIVSSRIAAPDARFIMFGLDARAPRAAATGVVIVTLEAAGAPRQVRLPFAWLADGARRAIVLPTVNESPWEGTVTGVSIRPVEDATGMIGVVSIAIDDIRVVGRIPTSVVERGRRRDALADGAPADRALVENALAEGALAKDAVAKDVAEDARARSTARYDNGAARGCRGSTRVKVLPCPGVLSALTRPPWAWT